MAAMHKLSLPWFLLYRRRFFFAACAYIQSTEAATDMLMDAGCCTYGSKRMASLSTLYSVLDGLTFPAWQ
ncbi:hypothetical protein LMH87_003287 [Akanthomyces muscarius]|uniref:Secreted protein n=1 Tax=Akanthomyces muscarius TaxID=2231603 RepID=A0A9W8UGG0_AKAMU|nr:hypothetical protein LMH87_003287 [Akanthomyces muscarius]KAJ4144403.1 hypothetical protein LMH87_003287 [Akanthomyces muscarius]